MEATTILKLALDYKPELGVDVQDRLAKLQDWDFSQLIQDMSPRLLLEEGRLFSIEQLIPVLLHFAQEDIEIKQIAQAALLPWLDNNRYHQQSSSLASDFIENACDKVKDIITQISEEFRKFVAISLIEPNQVHAPSGPVDMFWHFLILHTVDYNKFCEEVWGSHPFDEHVDSH